MKLNKVRINNYDWLDLEKTNDIKVEEKKIDLNFQFRGKGGPPKFSNSKFNQKGNFDFKKC